MTSSESDKLIKAKDEAEKISAQIGFAEKVIAEKLAREQDNRPIPLPAADPWSGLTPDYSDRLVRFGIDQVFKGHDNLEIAYAERQRAVDQRRMRDLAASKVAALKAESERLEKNRVLWPRIYPFMRIQRDYQNRFQITEDGKFQAKKKCGEACDCRYEVDLVKILDTIISSSYQGSWILRKHRHFELDGTTRKPVFDRIKIEPSIAVWFDSRAAADQAAGLEVRPSDVVPTAMINDRPLLG